LTAPQRKPTYDGAVQFDTMPTMNLTENSTGLSPKHRAASSSRPRMLIVGAWITGIASVGGLVAMVLVAFGKIRTGHGLDTFRSHWLVEDNWIGFLLSVGVITVVAVSAGVIGWFQRRKEQREIQQLQATYPKWHHG
jgi:hypothetical protein